MTVCCAVALIATSTQATWAESTASSRLVLICAPCHGFDGIGRDGKTPNLAGQQREYLQNQMAAFRSGQRKHPSMDFFSLQVNQDEIDELIGFYSELSSK